MNNYFKFAVILLISFGLLTKTNAFAFDKMIRENGQLDGKKILIQKFTIVCTYEIPNSAYSGWELVDRTYTIHIANISYLSDESFKKISPDIFGYYAWSDNTWQKFADYDFNSIWLDLKQDIFIGKEQGSCVQLGITDARVIKLGILQTRVLEESICDPWGGEYEMYIKLKNSRRGISRNTLKFYYEHQGLACTLRAAGMPSSDSILCHNHAHWERWRAPSVAQCKMVAYKKPPERLGF